MNDMELESMRQQLGTLKNKLNEQEIVNDRLIRRSMKKVVSNIANRNYILMVVDLLMIPYGYWCLVKQSGFSIAFWIGTCLFMLVCTGAMFYSTHKISEPDLMSHSLVEAREKVACAKKFDSDWLIIGIPAVILWLGWFFYELYQLNGGAMFTGAFWGACIGAILGTAIGLKMHFLTQHQYQEIIEQIEDLTEGA